MPIFIGGVALAILIVSMCKVIWQILFWGEDLSTPMLFQYATIAYNLVLIAFAMILLTR